MNSKPRDYYKYVRKRSWLEMQELFLAGKILSFTIWLSHCKKQCAKYLIENKFLGKELF